MVLIQANIRGQLVESNTGKQLEFDSISVSEGNEYGGVLLSIDCTKDSKYKNSYVAVELPYKEAVLLANLLTEQAKEAEAEYQKHLREQSE